MIKPWAYAVGIRPETGIMPLIMRINQFYELRQNDWKQLEHLLRQSQLGIHKLSPEAIETLGRLYRDASSDLALAQRDFGDHQVTLYLNQLVARAHAVVYRSEPLAYQRLLRFVTTGYPRVYRASWPFILAAMALFIIPALLSGLSTRLYPGSARWLLPAEMQSLVTELEKQDLWTDIPINERPYASSFIMQNNIQVAFLAFGGGMFAGLLTLWVMILNGLMLGSLTGVAAYYNIAFELWTFVIGHGVIELSVIMIAGGAGLQIGWAILHPGLVRRRDALSLAAGKAVRLLVGCVPLLVVAGLIEGFISPAENIPVILKWFIGVGSGVLLYSYLWLSGRERARKPHSNVRPFSSK